MQMQPPPIKLAYSEKSLEPTKPSPPRSRKSTNDSASLRPGLGSNAMRLALKFERLEKTRPVAAEIVEQWIDVLLSQPTTLLLFLLVV